jgi:hypothetical protein
MHAERERESAAERHDPTTALNQSLEGGDRDLTFHVWHNHLARCCRASARDGIRAASKTRAWRCVQSYSWWRRWPRCTCERPRHQFVHGGSTWPSPSVPTSVLGVLKEWQKVAKAVGVVASYTARSIYTGCSIYRVPDLQSAARSQGAGAETLARPPFRG